MTDLKHLLNKPELASIMPITVSAYQQPIKEKSTKHGRPYFKNKCKI